MALQPLLLGDGVSVLGDGGGDPVPPLLEGLHAEELPRQLVFQLREQKEVGGQVWNVGGTLHHLNLLPGGQEVLDDARGRCPIGG